ncbi:MAG: cell division protein FtsZ [Candidatus Babeliales bacterium]
MLEFSLDERKKPIACIKVIGIGGAGGNTINSMVEAKFQDIEFIAANTDAQALDLSKADHKIQLGAKSAKGLGTGANPELGKKAAEEDLDKVMELTQDADIVFLAGGMGGGTGSGALPVISRALREQGILTIAVVTKPFLFEGKRRAAVAEQAIETLKQAVDTLLILPNQKLLEEVDQNMSMTDAFSLMNNVLSQSVKGIADIITKPGHINVDFADVRTIMKEMGLAVMGTGRASGPDRAEEAALHAITSPLLENMSIEGARGVLLNISGGASLSLHEMSKAASIIYEQADENATIILGSVIDHSLGDEVIVTVIATGFDKVAKQSSVYNQLVYQQSVKQQAREEHVKHVEEMHVVASLRDELEESVSPQMHLEAEPVNQEVAAQPKAVEPVKSAAPEIIDLNDLDVPTYMRDAMEKG